MLCSFEPVKYCRAAPNDSAGTARRSTCMPAFKRSDVFVSPRAMIEATPAKAASRSIAAATSVADDDKIEVADGLLAASIAAGGNDLLDGPTTLHVANDFMHKLVGLDPKDSLPGLGGDFQPLQDGRLGLLPEAFEALNLVRLAGFAELVESGDFQIVIELCGPLWSEAGHAEDRQHALRDFAVQIFEHRQRAGTARAWPPSRPDPCRCPRCP